MALSDAKKVGTPHKVSLIEALAALNDENEPDSLYESRMLHWGTDSDAPITERLVSLDTGECMEQEISGRQTVVCAGKVDDQDRSQGKNLVANDGSIIAAEKQEAPQDRGVSRETAV